MPFASLDVHDVARIDLALFLLVGDHAETRGHDQNLVAVMRMPSGCAALAEVHDTAIEVLGFAWLDDGLA